MKSRLAAQAAKAVCLAATLLTCPLREVQGDIYLNGGVASVVNPATGENLFEPNEYDSFLTANADMAFNGQTGTPTLLTLGLNSFTLTGQDPNYQGLGLFFTADNVLLSTFALPPDLNVYVTGSGGFAFPTAGVPVATLGQHSGNAPYSGATTFTLGTDVVSVVDWDGSLLTLAVSAAVPEASAALAVGLIVCVTAGWCASRRLASRCAASPNS
jgi:hypothetical protein